MEPVPAKAKSTIQSNHLRTLSEELSSALRGLSRGQIESRPPGRPEAWSIQQIVEHLLLTYALTCNTLLDRIGKGSPTRKPASIAHRMQQFIVVQCGHFPSGRSAPANVMPGKQTLASDGNKLTQQVREQIDALDRLFEEGERVLGRGRSVTHVVMGPMSMAQWRKFQLVHGRHHIKQILLIRQQVLHL